MLKVCDYVQEVEKRDPESESRLGSPCDNMKTRDSKHPTLHEHTTHKISNPKKGKKARQAVCMKASVDDNVAPLCLFK